MRAADEVDHLVPVDGGGDFLDPANLQPLCRRCHHRKTAAENARREGRGCGPDGVPRRRR